jgi:ParB family transcriptional regulator, chromosome partitioning protein
MTTAAAGTLAGRGGEKDNKDKDKDKDNKVRRALGRGLASLLPGPRVVVPAAPAPGPAAAPSAVVPSASSSVALSPAASSALAPAPVADQTTLPALPSAGAGSLPEHSIRAGGVPRAGAPAPQTERPQTPTGQVLGNDIYAVADETVYADVAHSPQNSEGAIELTAAAESRMPRNIVANLAISDIDRNPFQTRHVQDDDALEELANSIKAQGVVQPIVVRPSDEGNGRYILILGERRLHASKKAGQTHIPALVRRVSLQQAAEMTIIENLQREDLSALEQAESFRVLSTTFNMTQQEIGDRVGLSRASIANYMRLLKLPREVMEMLANKIINFAQAKELLKLEDNDRISEAALYAVKKGMSIEQIEMLVLRMEGLLDPLPDMPGVKKKERTGGARWVDPNVRSAQMELERTLGLRVRIRDRKGKGKIVIEYATVDDYDRVVGMLRGRK